MYAMALSSPSVEARPGAAVEPPLQAWLPMVLLLLRPEPQVVKVTLRDELRDLMPIKVQVTDSVRSQATPRWMLVWARVCTGSSPQTSKMDPLRIGPLCMLALALRSPSQRPSKTGSSCLVRAAQQLPGFQRLRLWWRASLLMVSVAQKALLCSRIALKDRVYAEAMIEDADITDGCLEANAGLRTLRAAAAVYVPDQCR